MSAVTDMMTKLPGISPTISGSPLVAFYAQLNRYRGHSNQPPFDLATPTVTNEAALTAILLLQARLASGLIQIPDTATAQNEMAKLDAALKDPITYVNARLSQVTQTLAVYGDTIGLPVASVGITTSSVKRTRWGLALGLTAVLGLAAWGGYRYWRSRRSSLPSLAGAKRIVYENDRGYVSIEQTGKSESYIVWLHDGVAARKIGTFGTGVTNALARAKAKLDE